MLSLFKAWYNKKFSDPDAAVLLGLLIVSSVFLMLWNVSAGLGGYCGALPDWLSGSEKRIESKRCTSSLLFAVLVHGFIVHRRLD